jgi:hypothetical protein
MQADHADQPGVAGCPAVADVVAVDRLDRLGRQDLAHDALRLLGERSHAWLEPPEGGELLRVTGARAEQCRTPSTGWHGSDATPGSRSP